MNITEVIDNRLYHIKVNYIEYTPCNFFSKPYGESTFDDAGGWEIEYSLYDNNHQLVTSISGGLDYKVRTLIIDKFGSCEYEPDYF